MKTVIFSMLMLVSAVTVHAQTTSESTSQTTPQGQWTVHKQYDENGNLIAKDSTYTYSSVNGKVVSPEEADSLLQDIRKRLPAQFASADFFDQLDGDTMSEFLSGFDTDLFNGLLNNFNAGKFDELLQGFDMKSFDDIFEDFDPEEWSDFMKNFNWELMDTSSLQKLLKDEDWDKLIENHREEIQDLRNGHKKLPENKSEKLKEAESQSEDIQYQKI